MEEKKEQAIRLLIIRTTIAISFAIISLCAIDIIDLLPKNNTIIGIIVLIVTLTIFGIGSIEIYKFFSDIMYFIMSFNLKEENELSDCLKKHISKKLRNIIDK